MHIRCFVMAVTFFFGTIACATTQVAYTTADLIDDAAHVVLAQCRGVEFRSGQGLLDSAGYFYFDVEEVIKGDPPRVDGDLVLRLGGVNAASAPFAVDERVILFLGAANQDGYPTLYGSESTVLRVAEIAPEFPHPQLQADSEWIIKNGVTGLNSAPADPAKARPVSLEEFLEAARARVRNPR